MDEVRIRGCTTTGLVGWGEVRPRKREGLEGAGWEGGFQADCR